MGMDLKPINPSPDAPRHSDDDKYEPGGVVWGRYNWTAWTYQIEKLKEWGVDTSTFAGSNDGAVIPEEICKQVADAIERNAQQLPPYDCEWMLRKVILWRTCGGYEQF